MEKLPEADESVTLPLITADPHDYDLGTGNLFRLSSDADRKISGIIYRDVPNVRLVNVGAHSIVLQNEHSGSNVQNQIITGNGEDVILTTDDTALLTYDTVDCKWRLVA